MTLEWQDDFGLAGQQPFAITVHAVDDEAPTLAGEDLPRQRVVLDSETLSFKLRARDDFGVKTVGMEWKGAEPVPNAMLAKGERMLAAGGADQEMLELTGTFCAQRLEIEPQAVAVRLFVEDYFPDRGRVYSPHLCAVCPDGRSTRDLADRAIEQVASPIAGNSRSRNAALPGERATPRPDARGTRPARQSPPDRSPIAGRAGKRPAAATAWSATAKI